jgi:tRNA A-37 threonylcarbamoyl transferase component Bud32
MIKSKRLRSKRLRSKGLLSKRLRSKRLLSKRLRSKRLRSKRLRSKRLRIIDNSFRPIKIGSPIGWSSLYDKIDVEKEDIEEGDPRVSGKKNVVGLDERRELIRKKIGHVNDIYSKYYPLKGYSYDREKNNLLKINKCSSNPNIIKLKKFNDKKRHLFFDYNPEFNKTLEDVITEIPEDKKLKLAEKIYDTLNIIHKCGLVHGDFKAKNILINDNFDDIQLIDFGLSANKDDEDIDVFNNVKDNDITKLKYIILQLIFNEEYSAKIYNKYDKRISELNKLKKTDLIDFFRKTML